MTRYLVTDEIDIEIASGVVCPPGREVEITSHLDDHLYALRPRVIVIPDNEHDWSIVEFKIGNVAQDMIGGKGEAHRPDRIEHRTGFNTIQTMMSYCLTVKYVGANPDGAIFRALMIGTAVTGRDPGSVVEHLP